MREKKKKIREKKKKCKDKKKTTFFYKLFSFCVQFFVENKKKIRNFSALVNFPN